MARLPQPVTDPCKLLLTNDTLLSRLAYELARDLYPVPQILACYNVTEEQFNDQIRDNQSFMTFFAEARSVWNSSANQQQRIAAKAGILTEQWLDEADTLFHDPNNPMASKVELFKWMSRVAGVEAVFADRRAEVQGDTRTVVTINLGHAHKVIEKERVPVVEGEFTEVLPNGVTVTPQFSQPFAPTPAAAASATSPLPQRQPDNKADGEHRSYGGRLPTKPIENGR